MKFQHILLVIVLSIASAVAVVRYMPAAGTVTAKETAYERIIRTGVLRCGYGDWPPDLFIKDPQTGAFSGVLVDITDAVAAKLKLKVEWAENTGWGSFIESLKNGRIDAMCSGIWRSAERGRYIAFTSPIFYNAVYPYVAFDDHRFDHDLSVANQAGMRVAAMDGEMSDIIAKAYFPKATEISVPQLGQITDILMNVATHKADITFTEADMVWAYTKANPGSLRAAQNVPVQVFPASFTVEIHEQALRDMLDSAFIELQNQGVIETILSKYHKDPKIFLRVAKPYDQQTP